MADESLQCSTRIRSRSPSLPHVSEKPHGIINTFLSSFRSCHPSVQELFTHNFPFEIDASHCSVLPNKAWQTSHENSSLPHFSLRIARPTSTLSQLMPTVRISGMQEVWSGDGLEWNHDVTLKVILSSHRTVHNRDLEMIDGRKAWDIFHVSLVIRELQSTPNWQSFSSVEKMWVMRIQT